MKKLLLAALGVLMLGSGLAYAAAQIFTPSGVADVVAAYVTPSPVEYETVAASATAQAMGASGATGDYLDHCTLLVATAATAATTIADNATGLYVFANSPGGGIGVYDIPVHARSTSGAWKITTGAGVSVVCVGDFT